MGETAASMELEGALATAPILPEATGQGLLEMHDGKQ